MAGISKTIETNDDKLKERIEKLKVDADELLAEPQVMNATDGVFAQTKEWAISVTDLIKSHLQLEKDNADLVASNQERAKALTTMLAREKEFKEAQSELLAAIWPLIDKSNKTTLAEIDDLAQAYNKHKGE